MKPLSLALIQDRASEFTALKKWYRSLSQRAAVCIIIDDRPKLGCSLLMIQRAIHESDPWSGQMAFPGGKNDFDDTHITHTALREIEEELAIPEKHLIRFGRLSDVLARPYNINQKPMVISPLLFQSIKKLKYKPNHEVAEVIWVPLSFFQDNKNRQTMVWEKNGVDIQMPSYEYEGKKIWGLSLLMIDELVQELV